MGSWCVELYRFELGGAGLSKLDGLKALWRRNTRGWGGGGVISK